MPNSEPAFEVEIRCHFNSREEAYEVLPFVRTCLLGEIKIPWATRFYGLKLFQSGQLLRAGEAVHDGETVHFLGWKGPDMGTFANIRRELDETITTGIVNSAVLKLLGGKETMGAPDAVIQELERLDHRQFMALEGNDLAGYDDRFDVKVKLMSCPDLRWPLLVELEKTASTEEAAHRCENELLELSWRFKLQDRLVREEPPTLLYSGLFGR